VASPSEIAGKRVLVTGASGFTGRYVVAELHAHQCHVVGLGGQAAPRTVVAGAADADEFHAVDLRDQTALEQVLRVSRPDIIVHLAALAFVGHGKADEFYDVNMMGTRNLLQAIELAGIPVERVLLASSANVYGNSSEGMLDETTPPAPANDYAVSKLAMEYVAGLWRGRLPITITRPFNYTGVGQAEQFLVPKIISHFAKRRPSMELGNLNVSRDFGDVRAVASAYRQLLESPAAIGAVVNVCSGEGHSLKQIVEMCKRLTGHAVEVRVNPAFVRPNEVNVLLGDNRLLRSLIGNWQSPPLEDTLRWMLGAAEKA
jgi:nucleoside-diphosphate-sugar epimerase